MSAETFTIVGVITACAGVFFFLAAMATVVMTYNRYRNERERERENRTVESHTMHSEHHQRITILERDYAELRKAVDGIGVRVEQVYRNTEDLLKRLLDKS